MKLPIKFTAMVSLVTGFTLVILLSHCKRNDNTKNCCDGNEAKATGSRAISLVKQCHFIPEDSIRIWTERYQRSKKERSAAGLSNTGDILGDSSSFKSCIIRKILCNENSIGLRVVYGMSEDKKIHVILVGIRPDYATLYIEEPEECCNIKPNTMKALPPPPGNKSRLGGAEYGQMP
ncbi:MAG: hypothetical protein WKI04_02370 [Ferruginibacter sp.]